MDRRIYSVGIYARLSVEGSDRKNESIETQIEIAKEYMKGQGDMVLYGCYSDLGRSGTNFEREGFEHLMADVRLRRVDCVIVKDFSRFGRNYIETGNYIQKIFPFLGVRFVSVTDCFDSLFAESDDLGVNLKNLANEMYARDIALKVKSSKRAKRESGSYVGGIPPYGCRAEWIGGKKCLFAEAGAAEAVKWIFSQYDEGRSMKEIAAGLYAQEIHRPAEYHRYHHLRRQPGEALREWPRTSLKAVLTNAVYTECMERTDEAIVSRELFCRVAKRFEERAKKTKKRAYHERAVSNERTASQEKTVSQEMSLEKDIFDGVLFCGCCGKRLGRRGLVKRSFSGQGVKSYTYFCQNSNRIDDFCCGTGTISGVILTEMVKTVLRQEAVLNEIRSEEFVRENTKCAGERKAKIQKEINALQKRLKASEWAGSEQYCRYREGIISRETFQEWKARTEMETEKTRRSLEEEKRRIGEMEAAAGRQNIILRRLAEFSEKAVPDGELISALIESIGLYPGNRVEITFRFASKVSADMAGMGEDSEEV